TDFLYGGGGDDIINGSGGNDVLMGDAGNDTLNGGDGSDQANFFVAGSGNGSWSYAYDADLGGVIVKQGGVAVAKVSRGSNGALVVEDIGNASTGFGVDTLSGIENLTFDYNNSNGNYYNIGASAIQALFPSTVTKIDWVRELSDSVLVAGSGDDITLQVHFTNPVAISGAPTFALTFVDDAGNQHTVQATYQSYGDGNQYQTSMLFKYVLQDADVGRYHVGSIGLNGGSITEWANAGGLPADLALTSTRPITAGTYVYGGVIEDTTGTAGNDVLAAYEADPATAPTNGVYAGVDGGAGDRDILVVPVVVTGVSLDTASTYSLRFNTTTSTIEVLNSSGAVVSSTIATAVTVPSAASYPTNVETLLYHLVLDTGSGYEPVEVADIRLSKTGLMVADPINGNDIYRQGTLGVDTIDLSGDTSTSTRYLVRGGAGNDTITGHAGFDAIFGDGGNDTINAGGGNDRIFMGKGTDAVDGGTGFDSLVLNMTGQQLGLRGSFTGVVLQNQTGTWDNTGFHASSSVDTYRIIANDNGTVTVRENPGSTTNKATLTGVENVEIRFDNSDVRLNLALQSGTAGNETLTAGNQGMSVVMGFGGDDVLNASNTGYDTLMGGLGNDTLNGGSATDFLYGGAGDDVINGNGGNDVLMGDAGNDTIIGGQGMDVANYYVGTGAGTLAFVADGGIQGGWITKDGVNQIKITQNVDGSWRIEDVGNTTSTGAGVDTVSGVETLGFDLTTGGGYLSLSTRSIVTNVGTDGDDMMSGTVGSETFIGGAGNDTIDLGGMPAGDPGLVNGDMVKILALADGTDTVLGFKFNDPGMGGDIIDLSGIAHLGAGTKVQQFGSTVHDFGNSNVFIFDNASTTVDAVSAAIAADDDVTASQGFVIFKDANNGDKTTIYHSSDLASGGTMTALVVLSGVDPLQLHATNLIV
ncbi:Hemolysin-type calcium-binding repeat-containing protein, partial [Noviherbaspirillum humi]